MAGGRADPRVRYVVADADQLVRSPMADSPELRLLFHRLNNQLGIILAHAELLENKASDETDRARATQVVTSALDAMTTAREIRSQTSSPEILHSSKP
jgi:hypothetical protein